MLVLCVISFLILLGIAGKINSKVYIVFCLVCLSLMYYCVSPTSDFDLYRHYEIYSYIRDINVHDIFKKLNASSYVALLFNIYVESSPAYILYVFFLSRIGGSHLLILITNILVYGIVFYIIYDIGKKNGISDKKINLAIVFMLIAINYLDISGIRNILAISVILLGLYWDLILKKNRIMCIALYVIACLLHMSVIILVFLRLILLIKNKLVRRVSIVSVIFSIWIAVIIQKSGFNINGLGFIGNIINQVLVKLVDFVSGNGSSLLLDSMTTRFYILNLVARIGSVCICGIFYIGIYKKKTKNENILEYIDYLLLVYAFFVSSLIQYDLIIRTSMMVVLLMAPLLPISFSQVIVKVGNFKIVIKKKYKYWGAIVILGLICVLGIYYSISYRALDGLFSL